MRKWMWIIALFSAGILLSLSGCTRSEGDVLVLRVANSEEYIDEGGWDTEETIELEDGTKICGINAMTEDFEAWYEENYGEKIKVEYSSYGTNEELYNQMTLGDVFDLVCPSEYMIMKLMQEGKLQAYSDEFFDESKPHNYYVKGVSPYIHSRLERLKMDGKSVSRYGAGYMWGTMGIVYNPSEVSQEDVKHWDVLLDSKYEKRITMKDSVRDSYFIALSILNKDDFLKANFLQQSDYATQLSDRLNDVSQKTVNRVEKILLNMRKNAYSLETDSGKADMVTGKVVANMQWSGDAVYTLNQAEEDGVYLSYSVPDECTNLWLDGWSMIKKGIQEDTRKQQAAEAFVNFLSRPDNVVRNMYYIGYTSTISGGESDLIYQYAKYCYGTEDKDAVAYPLDYFFAEEGQEKSDKFILYTDNDQQSRQLYAQYPPEDVIARSVVMKSYSMEENRRISRMWTNIRCFDWSFY